MATLLLTAVGTLAGGPLGGAVGAIIGQQIDRTLSGRGSVEGPRLKELAASTSSYGQPIPRHYGRVRTPGTIIWATDLVESSEKSGGGKGRPKTTSYSYSSSFAVALSSSPVSAVGRIWADGNLLRGAAGDLKAGGTIRVHLGHGDQLPDPLLASALGEDCPGFRDIAYVVFEDLALGDFGNRIPALTFELFSEVAAPINLDQLVPGATAPQTATLEHLLGLTDEGGDFAALLGTLANVYPISCVTEGDGLKFLLNSVDSANQVTIPTELLTPDGDDEVRTAGRHHTRSTSQAAEPRALRYYDRDRDFQPSVQYAQGRADAGALRVVDLPATLSAQGARALSQTKSQSARFENETVIWNTAEIDPSIQPGSVVSLPGHPGQWIVAEWEWRDTGIQLSLKRLPPALSAPVAAESGPIVPPMDLPATPTQLWAFELPPDGSLASGERSYFAVAGSAGAGWAGTSLYIKQGTQLAPLDITTREQGVVGALNEPLMPSASNLIEHTQILDVSLMIGEADFSDATSLAMANGANRLLVGREIIQFACAEQIGASQWKLSGLLRGRGGTEHWAQLGHPAGTEMISLGHGLIQLDSPLIPDAGEIELAAIGLADPDPATATLVSTGASVAPLSPVHIRHWTDLNGDLNACWTRRARGQWQWRDQVDTPLVEESELYLVGFGPIDQPKVSWPVSAPEFTLSADEIAVLVASHGPENLWVRQVGTFSASAATLITFLPIQN
ncbi:MAG: hypothetical protein EP341_08060 [Sphingomonadales bacterium]|nr:MAG: hypothetical protein EP341_08060 [Sphingomonadales bacterium]